MTFTPGASGMATDSAVSHGRNPLFALHAAARFRREAEERTHGIVEEAGVLSAQDELPASPRRILVAGVSGVGKTHLAQRLSRTLGITHTEIDALFHGPGWTPRESFLDDVQKLVSGESWITEWQYADARPILAEHADLLVWLDLPFFTVTLPQVIGRTLRRRLLREELWNGNREGPLHTLLTDREHIIRWAWSTRHKYHVEVPALAATHPRLVVVRLRSRQEVASWLARTVAHPRG